jgi:hypothetical protein
MLRRTLLVMLGLAALTWGLAGQAQEPQQPKPGPGLDEKADKLKRDLALREQILANRFSEFRQSLLKLKQRLEASPKQEDRERAAILQKALEQAEVSEIGSQFDKIVETIKGRDLKTLPEIQAAMERVNKNADDLRKILDLLREDNRASKLREERARLEELLKRLEQIIAQERNLRAKTERMKKDDQKELVRTQEEIRKRTEDLAKKMGGGKGAEAKKGDAKAAGKGGDKAGESKNQGKQSGQSAEAKDQGKQGEGKPGESKGEPKEGGAKSGDKSGQGKEGSAKSGKGNPSESKKSGEGKEGEAKDGDKNAKGQEGEAKPGEKSSLREKKAEAKDSKGVEAGKQGDSKSGQKGGEAKASQPKSGSQGGESKPGESKSGSKSSGQGASKGNGSKGDQPSPDQGGSKADGQKKQQPNDNQTNPSNAKKNVEQGAQHQSDAEKKIDKGDKKGASDDEGKSIDELEKAKKKLEELLNQIREEELEKLLAALQARCQRMLEMQIRVLAGTERVDKGIQGTADKKADRVHIQDSLKLSDDEKEIVLEASKAIEMLEAEGSAVAFPEVFQQVRSDMIVVQKRLGSTDVGKVTQAIERDIIDTLKEMIEALKKARQDLDSKKSAPGSPPPPNQDQKLLDQIAELKMIRSMQIRVNGRTQMYGKQYQDVEGEQTRNPELRRELQILSERQDRIFEVTNRIARGDNK